MSTLVERLERIREVIAAAPLECLGIGQADGRAWPIRDEVVDGLSRCIEAAALRATGEGEWADEELARHWIDRYAAGIDPEPQMDRILECAAPAPAEPLRDAGAVERMPITRAGAISALDNLREYVETADNAIASMRQIITHPAPAQVDEEAVERAAAAVATVNRQLRDPQAYWAWLHEEERERYRRQARAALTAAAQEGK